MRRVGEYPLWVGNARDARDIGAVLDAGIEAVVDLAVDEPPVVPTRKLVYLRFPLVDGGGNPPWLLWAAVHALTVLVHGRVPTLVACGGGMSRSLAVTAAAVMRTRPPPGKWEEVLALVRGEGPADLHPELWESVRRHAMTMTPVRYEPRE